MVKDETCNERFILVRNIFNVYRNYCQTITAFFAFQFKILLNIQCVARDLRWWYKFLTYSNNNGLLTNRDEEGTLMTMNWAAFVEQQQRRLKQHC